MYAVGLMSGTSLDGIDVVLAEITGTYTDTKLNMLAFETYHITAELKTKIKQACSVEHSNVALICSLNFELGYLFAESVKGICKMHNFPLTKLDFIASHGQTIFHIPEKSEAFACSTLQIGEPAIIAYETGVKVISNFRTMDMAAGGQGAPLVPYSEFILYGNKGKNLLLQNIGGIGNVTFVPANGVLDDVFAFDTGPGNMIIDELMLQLYRKNYDKDGAIAALGQIDEKLLQQMQQEPYFKLQPPKSTGRELFGAQYVEKLLLEHANISPQDFITTATMFTAWSIADQYQCFVFPKHDIDAVVLSGGGAYNQTLKRFITQLLPNIEVLTQEDLGHSSDAKEALAFIVMGNETLNHNPSNVPSVTGANEQVVLGQITL